MLGWKHVWDRTPTPSLPPPSLLYILPDQPNRQHPSFTITLRLSIHLSSNIYTFRISIKLLYDILLWCSPCQWHFVSAPLENTVSEVKMNDIFSLLFLHFFNWRKSSPWGSTCIIHPNIFCHLQFFSLNTSLHLRPLTSALRGGLLQFCSLSLLSWPHRPASPVSLSKRSGTTPCGALSAIWQWAQ